MTPSAPTATEPNQRSWRGVAPDDRRAERRAILDAAELGTLGSVSFIL